MLFSRGLKKKSVYRIVHRKPTSEEYASSSIMNRQSFRYFLEYRTFLGGWRKLEIGGNTCASSFEIEEKAEEALRKEALRIYRGLSTNVVTEFCFSDLALEGKIDI